MSSHTEIEIKLEIPPAALAAVSRAVCTARVQHTELQALYLDSADRSLSHARMALRLRKEGTQWVQTLKAAGEHDMARLEHNVHVAHAGTGAPAADPQRHAGTAVGERMLGLLKGQPLQVQYRTEVLRSHRVLKRAGVAIELALDQGFVEAGTQRWPICELELELLQGPAQALLDEAGRWVTRHGLWLDVRSKAERGERLSRQMRQVPAVKARALVLSPEISVGTALRAVIANTLRQILPNACEIADGSYGDEHVHQLRVGLRRLRTALRLFAGWVDDSDPAWAPVLTALFRQLGGVRDRAAWLQAFAPALRAAGAPLVDLPLPANAPDPMALLRAPQVTLVWMALQAYVMSDPPMRAHEEPWRHRYRERVKRWHRLLLREAQRYGQLEQAAQHRVRKHLKRLRYATEFGAALFPARRVQRFLAGLAPAQEQLGLYNDLCNLIPLYQQAAAHAPEAWFAVGWLSAQRTQALAACVRELALLDSADTPWAKG